MWDDGNWTKATEETQTGKPLVLTLCCRYRIMAYRQAVAILYRAKAYQGQSQEPIPMVPD